jgi:hypothetical protein
MSAVVNGVRVCRWGGNMGGIEYVIYQVTRRWIAMAAAHPRPDLAA